MFVEYLCVYHNDINGNDASVPEKKLSKIKNHKYIVVQLHLHDITYGVQGHLQSCK